MQNLLPNSGRLCRPVPAPASGASRPAGSQPDNERYNQAGPHATGDYDAAIVRTPVQPAPRARPLISVSRAIRTARHGTARLGQAMGPGCSSRHAFASTGRWAPWARSTTGSQSLQTSKHDDVPPAKRFTTTTKHGTAAVLFQEKSTNWHRMSKGDVFALLNVSLRMRHMIIAKVYARRPVLLPNGQAKGNGHDFVAPSLLCVVLHWFRKLTKRNTE